MASPLPPDPYTALGVSKDADLGQIRSAHRKLVLKYHPDRIRGDDSEKDRAKSEFQKVQVAYELLADPVRRSRYDDRVKLAELRREKMMHEASRPTVYSTKTTPQGTTVHKRPVYEDRAPTGSYFESTHQYDDPISKSSAARKHDIPYEKERKPSSTSKSSDKREKVSSKWTQPVDGMSYNIATNLKAKANEARERVKSDQAKTKESRDREKRRERSDKHSGRRAAYVENDSSDSESSTIVDRHAPRPSKGPSHPRPEPESPRSYAPRSRRSDPIEMADDSVDEFEKWERLHMQGRDYIMKSQKRPGVSRLDSEDYVYWDTDRPIGTRRSGSDGEKRPSAARRTATDDNRRPPPIPVQSSAPSNLRPHVETREPGREQQRSQTNPYPADREARPIPNLNRSQTMPVHKSKKDSVPTRGSNLKHGETTQDSGYSSSSPHTETKGVSPPPSRGNSRKQSTKYTIVEPDSDQESTRPTKVGKAFFSEEDGRSRRYTSPEPEKRDRDRGDRDRERERDRERDRERPERERERERDRDRDRDRDRERERERERDRGDRERLRERERQRVEPESRTKSSRGPSSFPRGDLGRFDTTSPRNSPTANRGKLFGELSSDETYSYRHDPASVRTAAYGTPSVTPYGGHRSREAEDDYFKQSMRHTRRPSVY